MALPDDESGASRRSRAGASGRDGEGDRWPELPGLANAGVHFAEVFTPGLEEYVGRDGRRDRRGRRQGAWDVLCDITVAETCARSSLLPTGGPTTRAGSPGVEVWRDPRAIVGASDAGAHLDFLATFNYPTTMFAEAVRKRGPLATEEAVSLLTERARRGSTA